MSAPVGPLKCPDPGRCPVAVDHFDQLCRADHHITVISTRPAGWHRIHSARDGFASPNPGRGSTRFAPFDSATGRPVPTLYVAQTLTAALLETVFHNVDLGAAGPHVVTARDLFGYGHAQVEPPREVRVVDLRDDALQSLDIDRSAIVSSPAEHYPCTRRVAQLLHGQNDAVDGIVWHSRQAERHGMPLVEVMILFCDRVPTGRDDWSRTSTATAWGSLLEGAGEEAVAEVAAALGLIIEDNRDWAV